MEIITGAPPTEAPGIRVRHRPTTQLAAEYVCRRGHRGAGYTNAKLRGGVICAVCQKIRAYAHFGRDLPAMSNIYFEYLGDYATARRRHEERGGWLIEVPSGRFLVTDDEAIIRAWRGRAWIARCDRLDCWDEVELRAAGAKP
jgi:hypothetical protein